jgi:haloalkane dehalogenase
MRSGGGTLPPRITMEIFRTPDQRFAALAGFPFEPRYTELAGDGDLRIAHVEAGPAGGEPVLLLHGEPTWGFLYRKMIPPLAAAGLRVLAPDLVGFGRSDKPVALADYTYERHVGWMAEWLGKVELSGITLVAQDWGSLVGLRLVGEHPELFARVVIANGYLPTGDSRMPAAFGIWRAFARFSPLFPAGWIVRAGCRRPLSRAARKAYDAPFPNRRALAGARAFPRLVPTGPDDPAAAANRRAWQVLERFEKPFLTAFATGDPIFRGADRVLQKRIPGAAGQPHCRIPAAGHYVQEDQGERLAEIVAAFVRATPPGD